MSSTERKSEIAQPGRFPAPLLAEMQRKVVLLLQPFAPYVASELWEMLGEEDNLLRHPWPQYDPAWPKRMKSNSGADQRQAPQPRDCSRRQSRRTSSRTRTF